MRDMIEITMNVRDMVLFLMLMGFLCLVSMCVTDFMYSVDTPTHWLFAVADVLLFGAAFGFLLVFDW